MLIERDPPHGEVSFLGGFQMNRPEEEYPLQKTTAIFSKNGVVFQRESFSSRLMI